MPKNLTIKSRLVALACAVSIATSAYAEPPKQINVPAGDLVVALESLAKQVEVDLVYQPEQLKGLRTHGVSGTLLTLDAVKKLLEGTKLRLRVDQSTGAMLITPNAPAGSATSSATSTAVSPQDAKEAQKQSSWDRFRLAQVAQAKALGRESDLAQVIVEGQRVKAKAFSDGNVDIPRTVDDVQPYYILDREVIGRSGALNIEDLLKQRLTMNTLAETNSQISPVNGPNKYGNTSTVNLRGLGADKTLILVNGRRMAGVSFDSTDPSGQPDLNGIPLSAVERIEVLPSSASGIYGGSAIGGVVNIILKKHYVGGDVRADYGATWDMNAPSRTISASYGGELEGGTTNYSINGSWSKSDPLRLQDRASIYQKNLADIQSRSPNFIFSSRAPALGLLPNILNSTGTYNSDFSVYTPNPLVFDDGTALGSARTYVPAGTSPTTSAAQLAQGLKNNTTWSTGLPLSTQYPTGLLRPFGAAPETKSVIASVRRQMLPSLEMYADFSFNDNQSVSIYNPTGGYLTVPAAANPFTTSVLVQVPDASQFPATTSSQSRSATLGALVQLPRGWRGTMDFTGSENRFEYLAYSMDNTAMRTDLANGTLNPFVDTLLYPLNFQKYVVANTYSGSSRLYSLTARASGPLPSLPWGTPNLSVGADSLTAKTPQRVSQIDYAISTTESNRLTYYPQKSRIDGFYVEALVPLIKEAWLPLLRSVELQLSGRRERTAVDSGTTGKYEYYNQVPPFSFYTGTTLDGEPYFSRSSYNSQNYTVGLKYQPIEEVTLRVSRATAFLPPSPTQLLQDPVQSSYQDVVHDPRFPGSGDTFVYTLGGGNPDLKPQHSRSFNAGIIWEPRWLSLQGLRLNAEYYRIQQYDAIGYLSPQEIVDQESTYPGRVQRDASGLITLVDTSLVNLFHRDTEGWDLSANYALGTPIGQFSLTASQSIILHLKEQYARDQPEYDGAGYSPFEGSGAAGPKYRTNATLSWSWRQWAAGWTARYFGSYKQYGAAGGPQSLQSANGGVYNDFLYIIPQGSDTVASQMYHDLYISYGFDSAATGSSSFVSGLLQGVTAQLAVRNVFDKVPPLDVASINSYYASPFGDMRLRSWNLRLQKSF